MIKVRQAQLSDIEAILEIANSLHLDIPEFVWNKEAFIVKQINNGEYFVAEDSGSITGIMSLRRRQIRQGSSFLSLFQKTKKISIETLVVKKEFQRKGTGTQLLEFAKQFTKGKGLTVLHAYSFPEYHIADFYTKKGFKKLDSHGYYLGRAYDCFEMKLI